MQTTRSRRFSPRDPLVLAIVISDKAEDAFRKAMLMSKGSLGIFFQRRAGIITLLLPAGTIAGAGLKVGATLDATA